VLAAVELAEQAGEDLGSEAERKKAVKRVVDDVAAHLGNTPAVARSAYIDPRVIDGFVADDVAEGTLRTRSLPKLEAEVLDLITRRSSRRSKGVRA
jgi:DNA topoisomerase IB